jgi:hypothetical protein
MESPQPRQARRLQSRSNERSHPVAATQAHPREAQVPLAIDAGQSLRWVARPAAACQAAINVIVERKALAGPVGLPLLDTVDRTRNGLGTWGPMAPTIATASVNRPPVADRITLHAQPVLSAKMSEDVRGRSGRDGRSARPRDATCPGPRLAILGIATQPVVHGRSEQPQQRHGGRRPSKPAA